MSRSGVLVVWAVATCVVFSRTPHAWAADPKAFKLDLIGQVDSRRLGNAPAGDISTQGFNLYVDNPATHARVLGLEVAQHQNALRPGVGLVLPIQEFALGMNVPATQRCGLRVAVSQQTFVNDKPFASVGLYPYYGTRRATIEIGNERDQQNSDFTFFQWRWGLGQSAALLGASTEYYEEQRATLLKYRFERVGCGYLVDVSGMQMQGFVGGNFNVESERATWIVGFTRYASDTAHGSNPALLAAFRRKPESSYALAIFTLGGRSVNGHVSTMIHESFFRGGLKHSRIIGGRNFDTPGVGNSYESKDFGTVVVAASFMSVAAGTATLISHDVSGYGTLPGAVGPVVNPFVGVTWNEFSDLVYDPVRHKLDDPTQRYWVVKCGGKVKLADRSDRRNQLGYLRLGIEVNTNGGLLAKCTMWF